MHTELGECGEHGMRGSEAERILVVDDDRALLDALQRVHHKQYDLHVACGADQGLAMIRDDGPFAVVVSDLKMPGMDGVTFLGKVREATPDTVRVMLTGNTDLQSAIDAVKRGCISRCMTKPCVSEAFCGMLEASLEQYRLGQVA